jgi:hypothetical protein
MDKLDTRRESANGARPLRYELLYEARAELEAPQEIGSTPGGTRRIVDVKSGSFEGPRVRGEFLPGGGDWLLQRSDGTTVLDIRATARTDDGHLIYTNYRGYIAMPPTVLAKMQAGRAIDWTEYYFRTAPFFETSSQKYAWINNVLAVGIGEIGRRAVSYTVYEIK